MTALPCLSAGTLSVPHGFFTRDGGVSTGPYASLNGSLSGGDDPAAVAENRARVAARLDLPPANLVGLTQVHGSVCVTVTGPWRMGDGPRADAMVTSTRGIGLVVITADCAPVLLADAERGVIGAAHAGWRGATGGVLEATVAAMRNLGATRIIAEIGPCIAQASYQVGVNLHEAACAGLPDAARFFAPDGPGHWRFDLAGYCRARLDQQGVRATALDRDTRAEAAHFFSHRRRVQAGGGPIGHQMSAIRL